MVEHNLRQAQNGRYYCVDELGTMCAGNWSTSDGWHRHVALPLADQLHTDRAAVARVRDLHQEYRPAGFDDYDCCGHCNTFGAGRVYVPWPCPTIQALDGEVTR